jgi:medium-chain acyl-[acyl-carrier-protein] hydrolase
MDAHKSYPVLNETYTVRTHHFDPNGLFSAGALSKMLLDAAGMHAHELGVSVTALIAEQKTWMLSRFSVMIEQLPHWRDRIEITTWPSGIERLFALRDFKVTGPDGSLIATATSSWVVIDLAQRRPIRIEPYLQRFSPELSFAPGNGNPPKLPDMSTIDYEERFVVRKSDIDFNRHVTSTSYIGWIFDSIAPNCSDTLRVSRFDINYRAETFLGDTIIAQSVSENNDSILHRIIREQDGQELARARSVWTPR